MCFVDFGMYFYASFPLPVIRILNTLAYRRLTHHMQEPEPRRRYRKRTNRKMDQLYTIWDFSIDFTKEEHGFVDVNINDI